MAFLPGIEVIVVTHDDPNPPITGATEIRRLRLRLQLSQPQFANLLAVSAETYRTWDSGRRVVPETWLTNARELAATNDPSRLWSLQELATELGVHVRTFEQMRLRLQRADGEFDPDVQRT